MPKISDFLAAFSESLVCKKLYQAKYLFALTICLVSISLTAIAAPSDLDPTFGNLGKVVSDPDGNALFSARDLALQADGKIVMTGFSLSSNAPSGGIVARYNSDGSLDTTFGTNGWVYTEVGDNQGGAISLAIQTDGKIVVGFTGYNVPPSGYFGVIRYNTDGSLDTTFDDDGIAIVDFDQEKFPSPNLREGLRTLRITNDGKIVLAGTARFFPQPSRLIFAKLNPDGSLNETFGTKGKVVTRQYGPIDELQDMKVLSDGSIIAVGQSTSSKSNLRFINKYDANGDEVWSYTKKLLGLSLRTAFYGVAIQSDGKIVAAGYNTRSSSGSLLTRLNANGTEDNTFMFPAGAPGGSYEDVALQSDGKILVNFSARFGSNNNSSFSLARYNSDGSLDTEFGNGGTILTDVTNENDFGRRIILQPDGKILVGGDSIVLGGQKSGGNSHYFSIVRYLGDNAVPEGTKFDYDGDGKADISVYRPSQGVWYLNQSTNGVAATQFGISTDRIVPSDFDGDGKTDIAIYRDGVWWMLQSSDNTVKVIQFGIAEDKPQSGDFDGDGKDDLVVFRPSTGVWYILRSSDNGFDAVSFGISEDIPQSADYDGDGKTDIAVFRPSNGTWYIQKSMGGVLVFPFGSNGDIPVANDFNGDGFTEIAVWRPSEGSWYIYNLLRTQTDRINFGISEDIPVAADYDGDGKADIALFRPSNNVWYQILSTTGWNEQLFGLSNDKPTPSAYNP